LTERLHGYTQIDYNPDWFHVFSNKDNTLGQVKSTRKNVAKFLTVYLINRNLNFGNMKQSIAQLALLVHDYDKAIDFFTYSLQFSIIEDTKLSDSKRWVLIAPPGSTGTQLLLAKADNDVQKQAVGNQTGGRVFLFLHTDDFHRDYEQMKKRGVEFVRLILFESYGIVSVFKDLYGNLWDLIEPLGSKDDFEVTH
jgi:catechol 2,3-dioxygenase-like lactoylglutathione lyase family enzyme